MTSETGSPWMGIDLGTCSSSAAVLVGSEPQPLRLGYGEALDMPTAIFIEPSGNILVGEAAVNARVKDVTRYRDRFKLHIAGARGVTVPVGGESRTYSWTELVASVLARLRTDAQTQLNNGQPLSRAIITVPALYVEDGPEWNVMREAARLAGFAQVRLVREPHAAAIYCDHVLRQSGEEREGNGKVTLVYDLGGGTFDPALIRRRQHGYELVGALAGEEGVRCGGIFFDDLIRQDLRRKCPEVALDFQPRRPSEGPPSAEDFARARREARDQIELDRFVRSVKHRFASPDVAEVNEPEPFAYRSDYRITREELYALIGPLLDATLDSCKALIQRSGVEWNEIERIIMIGGSCHIPLVREKLETMVRGAGADAEICWRRVAKSDRPIDPLMAVCLGAALALDAPAMVEIAEDYELGRGVARNAERALAWYQQAAAEEYDEGEYRLGKAYLSGTGTAPDRSQAMHWYRRAGARGHILACFDLAELYRNGAAERDDVQAAEWYRRAAEADHAQAQCQLGECYRLGIGVSPDENTAARWYRRAADQGIAEAQFRYGEYCDSGSVDAPDAEAERWWRRAAEQGHAGAQCRVGMCCCVRNELEEGAKWFERSAQAGLAEAQHALGECYESGTGVPKAPDRAFEWFRKSAEQGFADAQVSLATCYESRTPPQYAEAISWLRKAAEQGHAIAQLRMGRYLTSGIGIAKDPAHGVQWFQKSAEQGNIDAQNSFGVCLFNGIGMKEDEKLAMDLFSKVAATGHGAGMRNLAFAFAHAEPPLCERSKAREWFVRAAHAGYESSERDLLEMLIVEAFESTVTKRDNVHVYPRIPDQKLVNVNALYKASLRKDERVLALWDSTVFGAGDLGVIVTTYGVGMKQLVFPAKYWKFADFDYTTATLKTTIANMAWNSPIPPQVKKFLHDVRQNGTTVWPRIVRELLAGK